MYTTGYPTYLGYPTYAPMQYYPSLGAYSYAMQPSAQLRPTIMIPVSLLTNEFGKPSLDKLFPLSQNRIPTCFRTGMMLAPVSMVWRNR